jgi:hypothetical protein
MSEFGLGRERRLAIEDDEAGTPLESVLDDALALLDSGAPGPRPRAWGSDSLRPGQ